LIILDLLELLLIKKELLKWNNKWAKIWKKEINWNKDKKKLNKLNKDIKPEKKLKKI
jgi:hypothetical protein